MSVSRYFGVFKTGNRSLSNNILIFSMGSVTNCPIRLVSECGVINNGFSCYAEKSEKMYPYVLGYREKCKEYWLNNNDNIIIHDIESIIRQYNGLIRFFRFNESSDFSNQDDELKLSSIASYIKKKHSIITYGYTNNQNIDFSKSKFIVYGSFFNCKNGMVTVIKKADMSKYDNMIICKKIFGKICGKDCHICMNNRFKSIAMIYHNSGTRKIKR